MLYIAAAFSSLQSTASSRTRKNKEHDSEERELKVKKSSNRRWGQFKLEKVTVMIGIQGRSSQVAVVVRRLILRARR